MDMTLNRRKKIWCCLSFALLGLGTMSTVAQDAAPKIAFISDRDGVKNLFVMEADGSDATNLTDGEMRESGPLWSPDGQTIAFSREIDNDVARDIFAVALDGSEPVQLTDG